MLISQYFDKMVSHIGVDVYMIFLGVLTVPFFFKLSKKIPDIFLDFFLVSHIGDDVCMDLLGVLTGPPSQESTSPIDTYVPHKTP